MAGPDFSSFGTLVDEAKTPAVPDFAKTDAGGEKKTALPDFAKFGTSIEAPQAGKHALDQPGQFSLGAEHDTSSIAKDFFHSLDTGVDTAAADLMELVRRVPVVGEQLKSADDSFSKWFWGQTNEDALKNASKNFSPEYQASREKKWWDDKEKWFGPAWSDPRSYTAGFAESLPEEAMTVLPAMRLAKGAFTIALAKTGSEKLAANAAARTAMLVGGTSEGMLAGAQSSRQVRDDIKNLPEDTLRQSDAVKSLMAEGKSYQDAVDQVANDGATRAFFMAGVSTGIFSGMGDRVLAKLIMGTEGGLAKRIIKGAVTEGVLEEFPQSYLQQVSQNYAMREANPKQDLFDDALNQGLAGLAIGAMQGGAMTGALARTAKPQEQGPLKSEEVLGKEGATPPPPPGGGTIPPLALPAPKRDIVVDAQGNAREATSPEAEQADFQRRAAEEKQRVSSEDLGNTSPNAKRTDIEELRAQAVRDRDFAKLDALNAQDRAAQIEAAHTQRATEQQARDERVQTGLDRLAEQQRQERANAGPSQPTAMSLAMQKAGVTREQYAATPKDEATRQLEASQGRVLRANPAEVSDGTLQFVARHGQGQANVVAQSELDRREAIRAAGPTEQDRPVAERLFNGERLTQDERHRMIELGMGHQRGDGRWAISQRGREYRTEMRQQRAQAVAQKLGTEQPGRTNETDQALIERLNARTGRKYTAAQVPVSADARAGVQLAQSFGKRVVFFNGEGGTNGVVLPEDPNTIYVNANTQRPHIAIIGHELLHTLRRTNEAVYQQLLDRIVPLIKNVPEYREWLAGAVKQEGYSLSETELKDLAHEELIADFLGDHMMQPQFWSEVFKGQNRTWITQVRNAVMLALDAIRIRMAIGGKRGFGSERYIKDTDGVRRAMADAFNAWSKQQTARISAKMVKETTHAGSTARTAIPERPAGPSAERQGGSERSAGPGREAEGAGQKAAGVGGAALRSRARPAATPLQVAQSLAPNYNPDFHIPESSLAKQGAIGKIYEVAAAASPAYQQAVFAAYQKAMPAVLKGGDSYSAIDSYKKLVQRSYADLVREVRTQYAALIQHVKVEYHSGAHEYTTSDAMREDVLKNHHLWVYEGGERHEFLGDTDPATGRTYNEMFRAIHDYFGHVVTGASFGPKGEEQAWASHVQMLPRLARIAMTSETRGQNSFVNYTSVNVQALATAQNMRREGASIEEIKKYLSANFQYAKQASVALPPEFLDPRYAGGLPEYLRSAVEPQHATSAKLVHYSPVQNLSETDPSHSGTGKKGQDSARLKRPGAVPRTYFYLDRGQPITPENGLGPHRYEATGRKLYDISKDQESLWALATHYNRPGGYGIDRDAAFNSFEKLIYDRGYDGYVSPDYGASAVFTKLPVKKTEAPLKFRENNRPGEEGGKRERFRVGAVSYAVSNGMYDVSARSKLGMMGGHVELPALTKANLSETFGKPLADRMISGEGELAPNGKHKMIHGLDQVIEGSFGLPPGAPLQSRERDQPRPGYWEGPNGEFEETDEAPTLAERARELALNDRRWYAKPNSSVLKSRERLDTGIKLTRAEQGASLDIFVYGDQVPPQYRTLKQAAEFIEEHVLTLNGGKNRAAYTEENAQSISKIMAHEALLAIDQAQSSAGWYRKSLEGAIEAAAQKHPEIATNPDARFAFTYALAVTSNGSTVRENTRYAFEVYEKYKDHGGKMPYYGKGPRKPSMARAFMEFNYLKKELGSVAALREFMLSKHPVKTLRMAGYPIRELIDEEVYGGTVIGPKIGGGFLQNLNGNYDALTIDRWLMRSWGRMTGQLVSRSSETGIIDAPPNPGMRTQARKTVDLALAQLKERGKRLTVSDLQSLLWYPEKDFYQMLGVADANAAPTDYYTEVKRYVEANPNATEEGLEPLVSPDRGGRGHAAAEPGRGGEARAAAQAEVAQVDQAAHEAATSPQNALPSPTAAQAEAGNYQKGHVTIAGLDVSIENPEGSQRRPEWPALKSHYGYIRGTVGKDKDHLDIFVKPGTPQDYAGPVFVIDQKKTTGHFDEHKVMLGWATMPEARAGYSENYSKDWDGVRAIVRFENPEAFKAWIEHGDTKAPVETQAPLMARDERPDVMYHVTPAENINTILKEGLRPLIGERSKALGEKAPATYLFTSADALEDALQNWMGDNFDEEQKLALFAVDTSGHSVSTNSNAPYEATSDKTIPASRLRLVARDVGSLNDLRTAIEKPLRSREGRPVEDVVDELRTMWRDTSERPGKKFEFGLELERRPNGDWVSPDGRFEIERTPDGYYAKVDSIEIGWGRDFQRARAHLLAKFKEEVRAGNIINPMEAKSVFARYTTEQQAVVVTAWKKIASLPNAFRFARSEATDLKTIAKDMGVDRVIAKIDGYDMNEPEGKTGWINIDFIDGTTAVLHYSEADKTAYLNASEMNKGGYGAQLYQSVLTWAANNKYVLVPDPGGLSLTNAYRRTEQMISAALRLDTTRYMRPHADQGLYGWISEPKTKAEEDHNFAVMLLTSYENVFKSQADTKARTKVLAELSKIAYNFDQGRFEHDGKPVTNREWGHLAHQDQSSFVGSGVTTLQRAVLTQSILDAARERSGKGVAALVSSIPARGIADEDHPLRGVLYARERDTGGGQVPRPGSAAPGGIVRRAALATARGAVAAARPVTAVLDLANRAADAAFKLPAKLLVAPVTSRLYDRVVGIGRAMAQKSAFVQEVAHGSLADYGLPEPYLDARQDRENRINKVLRQSKDMIDRIASLDRAEARVAYLWMQEAPSSEHEQQLLAQLPESSRQSLAQMKEQIDQLGQEAVKLGLLSPESFERNRMAYLHRTYRKYELENPQAVARSGRAKNIKADAYRGRGLRDDVAASRVPGAQQGDHYTRLEQREPATEGLGALKRVVYLKAGIPIPSTYAGWRQDGTWEARWMPTKEGQPIGMWRDLSPEERQRLGEIDEVRYAFARTMLATTRDIETARFLKHVAENYAKPDEDAVVEAGGRIAEAVDSMVTLTTFADNEWVQVPTGYAAGTKIRKYGALAGQFVPGHIWNDIRSTINTKSGAAVWRLYDQLLRGWKISKTALSPVVHTNNVMSNFILADMANVGFEDTRVALRTIIQAQRGDEVARTIMERYYDSGAEGGSQSAIELRREIIEPFLAELEREQDETLAQVGLIQAISLAAHGNWRQSLAAISAMKSTQLASVPFKVMIDAYRSEDAVFRLAKFMKETAAGKSDREAGKEAKAAFLDYNINAPWIQALRRGPLPFVSFSYRAIPLLIQTAAKQPWKMMKYFAVGYGLNALAYAMLGSAGDEDKERKLMPDEKSGRALGVFYRMLRMPWNDENGSPVFFDVRRWIPGGDIVDLTGSQSAIPLPSWMSIGGPLSLMIELVANKNLQTGKPIVKESDTTGEAVTKISDHLFKFASPNLPVPNPLGYAADFLADERGLYQTYSWKSIQAAGTGETDAFGRERSLPQSLASSVGFKLSTTPEDVAKQSLIKKRDSQVREIGETMSGYRRQHQVGGLTDEEYAQRREAQQVKKQEVTKKFNERLGLEYR